MATLTYAERAEIEDAFPDYDVDTLPALPDGFVAAPYRNDVCPRFDNARLGLTLWIDYAEMAEREVPRGSRFALTNTNADDHIATILETDDWRAVLAIVGKRA